MIGIIDYGIGNLRSVQKAFELVGAQASILANPSKLDGVTHLVLPGVGAFADGMEQLERRQWIAPVKSFVASGKPFLGICLGMQLIFDSSEEIADECDAPSDPVATGSSGGVATVPALVPGLALLPGKVRRFRAAPGTRLKVPHMGWNTLRITRPDPLMAGIKTGDAVYFVHGYYVEPREAVENPISSALADYPDGVGFTASVWRGNIWGTQFHPEKSQNVGIRMLGNFAKL